MGRCFDADSKPQNKGDGFEGLRWLRRLCGQVINYRDELALDRNCLPPRPSDLCIVVALLKPKKLIDFGGGAGWGYDYINNTLINSSISEYQIIETQKVCEYVKKSKIQSKSVEFISDFSQLKKADLLYTNSTLQYVHQDKIFLDLITRSDSNHILIEDFYAGDFEDYYTEQIYYESKIVVKHRNLENFISLINRSGFDLLYSKPYMSPIRGKFEKLPMSNLPEKHRINFSRSLLFTKKYD